MAKAKKAARLRLTDTTFRDGNQSLLGGHLRGEAAIRIAKRLDRVGFHSIEAFGGATFETHLSLGEDPWEQLRRLRKALPNTPIQALVRGQNLVGAHNYADDTVELFIAHAAACGVDVFRIFDPLNDLRNMEVGVAAAKKAGKRVQGAICYTLSPAHNLDLWCSLAAGLAGLGADEVVIKDTAGLLSPQHTWELVTAIRQTVKLPVVVHSHCSTGMAPMAYMAGVEAGATVLDTALSPLAWGTSQPSTESVVAALQGGDYDTGLDLNLLLDIEQELRATLESYQEFRSPRSDRVESDILRHQLPGHMLSDLYAQLEDCDAGGRLREVLEEVTTVRRELGWPPLVAPVRSLVAAQAVYNVVGGDRYATVTQELKDYLQGLYGTPPVPADPQVRRLVLGREEPITIRPADLIEPQVATARAQLAKAGRPTDDGSILLALLFPVLAADHFRRLAEPRPRGGRKAAPPPPEPAPEPEPEPAPEPVAEEAPPAVQTAEFQVEVDGEQFTVRVTGAGLAVAPGAYAGAAPATAPARASARGTAIPAPMQGLIVRLPVKAGDEVKLGDVVAVLEAMKMQNDIVTPVAGRVLEVLVREGEVVSPNQAIMAVG